jgi:hypothetical protein
LDGRAFLAQYFDEEDLLKMVQYHDEGFSLWRRAKIKGKFSHERLNALVASIKDWNVFLAFSIVDGCTRGKEREPLRWLFEQVSNRVESKFTSADII